MVRDLTQVVVKTTRRKRNPREAWQWSIGNNVEGWAGGELSAPGYTSVPQRARSVVGLSRCAAVEWRSQALDVSPSRERLVRSPSFWGRPRSQPHHLGVHEAAIASKLGKYL